MKVPQHFTSWLSTLKGLNRDIENRLFVGCDRQKSIVTGLSRELPIAQFLACTKHVQDNIKRKMSSLFIPEKVQTEYLHDIFGDRSNKGLIDSDSASDFDEEAHGMKEKSNTVGKKPPNFTVISLPTFL